MVNEAMPHQLTVGQLRHILEGAQEQAVVVLQLPAGHTSHPELAVFVNVAVRVVGPIVVLSPQVHSSGKLSAS